MKVSPQSMTWEEIIFFIEANKEAEQAIACVLLQRKGHWILCIGETQTDKVFRHIAWEISDDTIDVMLRNLREAAPEKQKNSKKIQGMKVELNV